MKAILLFLFITAAWAQPGIIFIHGLGNFTNPKIKSSELFSRINWSKWKKEAFPHYKSEEIIWSANQRIHQQLDHIVSQYLTILSTDHCDDGCIIVTHSTGGLVADILLSSSRASAGSENDFSQIQASTLYSIQVASAIGGSSFATHAISWLEEHCKLAPKIITPSKTIPIFTIPTQKIKRPIGRSRRLGGLIKKLFPNIDCDNIEGTAGIFYDLQPHIARQINGSDETGVTTLMIAGDGTNYMANIVAPFLIGANDGMIEMHSSCGARQTLPFESCVSYTNAAGQKDRIYYAPEHEAGYYANHFPFIMTEENHMQQVISLSIRKAETIIHSYNSPKPIEGSDYIKHKKTQFKNIHLARIVGELLDFTQISQKNSLLND